MDNITSDQRDTIELQHKNFWNTIIFKFNYDVDIQNLFVWGN